MPSRDPDRERDRLAAAVGRLVAQGGLAAVSLRSVAAEAGVSMGRVQHYYRSKSDLLLDALRRCHRAMEDRIVATLPRSPTLLESLAAILTGMLDDSPQVETAIRVNAAYAITAVTDPEVKAVLVDGDQQILDLAAAAIAQAAHAKELNDVDAELEARALVAAGRGLASGVVLYGEPRDKALATLNYLLERYR